MQSTFRSAISRLIAYTVAFDANDSVHGPAAPYDGARWARGHGAPHTEPTGLGIPSASQTCDDEDFENSEDFVSVRHPSAFLWRRRPRNQEPRYIWRSSRPCCACARLHIGGGRRPIYPRHGVAGGVRLLSRSLPNIYIGLVPTGTILSKRKSSARIRSRASIISMPGGREDEQSSGGSNRVKFWT
jgi:hypothetical protein